ncbi:hypothetical protein [Aeromonas veronii]|uniref:hypothetical protein n=1 Tax=Aeromonas veronii TaxID=654 RepID=UPI002B4A7C16|nr:hypothetical protein [Aeromonas veronii]
MSYIKGSVGYLQLSDWWLNELSQIERDIILNIYNPMGYSSKNLIVGDIISTSETRVNLISGIASWLKDYENLELAKKLFTKAENLIDSKTSTLDIHFLYHNEIKIFYKHRIKIGIEPTINSCEKQIRISVKSAKALISEYGIPLPSHKGYQQLAIILEKLAEYQKCIKICIKAKNQGWSGDWDKRIERCLKKT